VDVPVSSASQRFDFSADALGFGTYRVTNDLYDANDTYSIDVELSATNQVYGESGVVGDSTLGGAVAGTSGYGSHTRIPPTIRVAQYKRDADCERSVPDVLNRVSN